VGRNLLVYQQIELVLKVIVPFVNTVDVTKATYTNTIGSGELTGTWIDPSFDAK